MEYKFKGYQTTSLPAVLTWTESSLTLGLHPENSPIERQFFTKYIVCHKAQTQLIQTIQFYRVQMGGRQLMFVELRKTDQGVRRLSLIICSFLLISRQRSQHSTESETLRNVIWRWKNGVGHLKSRNKTFSPSLTYQKSSKY